MSYLIEQIYSQKVNRLQELRQERMCTVVEGVDRNTLHCVQDVRDGPQVRRIQIYISSLYMFFIFAFFFFRRFCLTRLVVPHSFGLSVSCRLHILDSLGCILSLLSQACFQCVSQSFRHRRRRGQGSKLIHAVLLPTFMF